MYMTRSEYDRGVNTFSPEGRLFQLEYAMEAMKLGSTAIGICTKEGIVLGVEKRIKSPLIENQGTGTDKIFELDYNIGCAVSGLMADAKILVDYARIECANHFFGHNEKISVESLAQATSNLAIRFGDSGEEELGMSRPFGVGVIFAGVDEQGFHLFHLDPAGTYGRHWAKPLGAGWDGARAGLEKNYNKNMTLEEAKGLVILLLKQVMEESLTSENVEIATVTHEKLFQMHTKEEVQALVNSLEGVELAT